MLLHRPDFYSILSAEDSFEWTFHNEKFSDLDIKFIPRVEKQWSEAKAKSSLKGNASATPESIPEDGEKQDSLLDLGARANVQRGKPFNVEDLRKTLASLVVTNSGKPQQSTGKTGNSAKQATSIDTATRSNIQHERPIITKDLRETLSSLVVTNSGKSQQSTRKVDSFNTLNVNHFKDAETTKAVKPTVAPDSQRKKFIYKSSPRPHFSQDKPQISVKESKVNPDEEQQYRTPFVRDNVVFFQSSPTLTYKRTKLKFLPNKADDYDTTIAEPGKDVEDNLMWSSTARLGKETQKQFSHKPKPELSLEKADEVIRKRHAYRKLCKLDEIEAKFISGNASETSPPAPSTFLPKTNTGAATRESRRGSNPQILLSSSLDSAMSKKYTPQSSIHTGQPADAATAKLPEVEKPPGQRRSARDVIQWLFEGRAAEAARLRRRRSSRDLGAMKGTATPGSLRNWLSLPSRKVSNVSKASFTDRSHKSLVRASSFFLCYMSLLHRP